MNTAEGQLLNLRDWIQSTFTRTLRQSCNLKQRVCRGASKDLYKLIVKHPDAPLLLKLDTEHLQIISGMGHTYIRYKDDLFNRFIYIDPTIGQFIPSFDGIFIGTEEELQKLAKESSNLNIRNYLGGKDYPLPRLEVSLMKLRKSRKSRRTRRRRAS